MNSDARGPLVFAAIVLGVLGVFLLSKQIGCHFPTLMVFVAAAVVTLSLAFFAVRFGIDAMFCALVASVVLWSVGFPVIDSIALGGSDPKNLGMFEKVPAVVPYIKYSILAVLVGLTGWRGRELWAY